MTSEPEWWRGVAPPERPPADWGHYDWIIGRHARALDAPVQIHSGLRTLRFVRAELRDIDVALTDAHLSVAWSEFDRCTFRQRVRPVLNEYGVAAQGSFGIRPSVYRDCVFEKVRFKQLGGFSMSAARFERCTFVDCRWEGHFAQEADLVDNTFIGRMNGCVWLGHGKEEGGKSRKNVIQGNDFTQTRFTDNVGWRLEFPIGDQSWPADYTATPKDL